MRTYRNNPLTVSNTKSLKYICGNITFEALNLHREKTTLEKIVPQGLIRNTEYGAELARGRDVQLPTDLVHFVFKVVVKKAGFKNSFMLVHFLMYTSPMHI